MRYDQEQLKLLVDAKEMTLYAMRRIAKESPRDEDIDHTSPPRESIRKKLHGDTEKKTVKLEFSEGGFDFLLKDEAYVREDGALSFIREAEGTAKRIKKELISEARGEAFLVSYAYLLELCLDEICFHLSYYDPRSGVCESTVETVQRGRLETFFNKCKMTITVYALPEIERATVRLPSMKALKFPHKSVRESQSEFMAAAYSEISHGGTLIAEAPTGTGKTVSALYPALRAMGCGRCEKVFYFTPKATIAKVAKDCLLSMEGCGATIRAIILKAKERTCKRGLLCRDSRELCEASASKLISDATLEVYNLKKTVITEEDLYPVSKKYKVCPYELSLCYSELCDVVICDFNYLFDPKSYIRRFFTTGGDYAFLFDEAHNLPERAREMYSSELSCLDLTSALPSHGEHSFAKEALTNAEKSFYDLYYRLVREEIREGEHGEMRGFTHLSDPPLELYPLLEELIAVLDTEIQREIRARDSERNIRLRELRDIYYKVKGYYDSIMRFDSHYELFISYSEQGIKTKVFCIDPSGEISKRTKLGRASVFFSATLTPLSYYRSTLGGDRSARCLELSSPFVEEQLSVSVLDKISTRYQERERTAGAVVKAIAAAVSPKAGNYMVFTPSFEYAEALSYEFQRTYPKVKTITQKRKMTDKEREEFLQEFKNSERNKFLIGFAVLGGIWAEGIDLAGESLIGAVIVGIGMPQLSSEREAIRAYYDEKLDEGMLYAYVYPGINRVLQAAGRVIRREDDRGIIALIDDRFDDPIYRKIMPDLWRGLQFVESPKALKERISEFWQKIDTPDTKK